MRLLFFFIFLFSYTATYSQSINLISKDSTVVVGDIIISGNKKTRTNIILRELFFKKGDTLLIHDFEEKIKQSRAFVFNTTLFVDVEVTTAKQDSNRTSVIVLVKERWYLFPVPYFKLVDRNFNEWWVNQNRDFSRVNYGLKFFHNNLTGRNDKLNVWLITGYNRQVSLRYENPFVNKKLTNGINIGFSQSKQKEINYRTDNLNKQQFLKVEDGFARNNTRFDFAFTIRPDQKFRHTFRTGYTWESINDSVAIKNPNYYGSGLKELSFLDFSYSLQYFNTNYNIYPTKGFIGTFSIYKRGLNKASDFTQLTGSAVFITPLSKKMFWSTGFSATAKFPHNENFINQGLFGYGDFQIRGLENYVVDGVAGIMNRNSLGLNLFTYNLKLPIKSKTLQSIPFKFYPKIFCDVGYSHNPYKNNDLLGNRFLYSYGFGLDIVSIYDVVIKFEYSFNQLGSTGFVFGSGN